MSEPKEIFQYIHVLVAKHVDELRVLAFILVHVDNLTSCFWAAFWAGSIVTHGTIIDVIGYICAIISVTSHTCAIINVRGIITAAACEWVQKKNLQGQRHSE